jgi:hypothetical protein
MRLVLAKKPEKLEDIIYYTPALSPPATDYRAEWDVLINIAFERQCQVKS